MKTLFLLVAALATAAAIQEDVVKCIDGCKCTSTDPPYMKISRCTKNFSLKRDTFVNLGMEKVSIMEFAGAMIDTIENSAFSSLKHMEIVFFKNSHIAEIEEFAFNLPKMTKLSFSGCSFNDNFPVITSNKVREVVVTRCNLVNIPTLKNMTSLVYVDLSHNYIKAVSKSDFKNLDNLETIILSNNNITAIDPESFSDTSSLSELYLNNNPLKFFSVNTELFLEKLSLSSCRLTTFDHTSAKYLSTVVTLDLSGNKIPFLPNDAFENMREMNFLDLSRNNLKHLDVNIFKNNKKLEKITLDKNHFPTLPPFLANNGTFAVTYFSCKNCGIKSLSPDSFKHMLSIQILDLSGNRLETIEKVLEFTPSLIELDLSFNRLLKITPNTFNANSNLKSLKVRGNPLIGISSKVFSSNRILTVLDMSDTGLLQMWTNNKIILPSIRTLYISNNSIQSISTADLNVVPNLDSIYLEANKFKCTNNFREALRWLNDKSVRRVAEINDNLPDFIGGNTKKTWRELAKNVCPGQNVLELPEIKEIKQEYLENSDDEDREEEDILPSNTNFKSTTNELDDYYDESYDDDDNYFEDDTTESSNAISHKYRKPTLTTKSNKQKYYEYQDLGITSLHEFDFDDRYTLTKTSYVVLVTSVFILTALLVIVLTVSTTMLILKKNRRVNVERASLPRFKIPRWSSIPAQKKHSGSVYQTLTEDYSGPKTPIFSRYEFNSTPTVHNHTSA